MVQVVGGRLTCQCHYWFRQTLPLLVCLPLHSVLHFTSVGIRVTLFSLYEEAAIASESVIGCLGFASVMSFSSCFSHSPLAPKVPFLCYPVFDLLLLHPIYICSLFIYLYDFFFHCLPFSWLFRTHSFLKWGFLFNFEVLNFEWILVEDGLLP